MDWLAYKVGIRHKVKVKPDLTAVVRALRDRKLSRAAQFHETVKKAAKEGASGAAENGKPFTLNNIERLQNINMSSVNAVFNKFSTAKNENNQEKRIGSDPAILELSKKLDVICDRLKSMDEEDLVQTEWRTVAMTIDRIVFCVVVFICAITILACILCIPHYAH